MLSLACSLAMCAWCKNIAYASPIAIIISTNQKIAFESATLNYEALALEWIHLFRISIWTKRKMPSEREREKHDEENGLNLKSFLIKNASFS